jgi:hypothetical protein
MGNLPEQAENHKPFISPFRRAKAEAFAQWVDIDGPFHVGRELYRWMGGRFAWTRVEGDRAISDAARLGLVRLAADIWGINVQPIRQGAPCPV